MTLHPVIAEMVERNRVLQEQAGATAPSVAESRAQLDAGTALLGAGPQVRRVQDLEVPGRGGRIGCRLYDDAETPVATVVYVHGGGWALGGPTAFDPFARALCRRSGARVVLVDYALAPESPFPRGLHDVEDVMRWAAEACGTGEGARSPLVMAGDSAGANLVAAAVAELAGTVEVSLQVLLYPVTDCDFDTASYRDHGSGLLITRETMEWFFRMYAAPDLWTDPRISVLRRTDLASSPPTWLATAEYDLLRDEGEAFAAKLAEAGVEVTLRRYPGVTHGFLRLFNLVDTADDALNDIASAVRNRRERLSPLGVD